MKISLDSKKEKPVNGGRFVVGAAKRTNRAICWASHVDGTILRAIFNEVDALGLARPITVYGHTSSVCETETFTFKQVSGSVRGFMPNVMCNGPWSCEQKATVTIGRFHFCAECAAKKRAKGPMPRVTYDGQESVLKSRKTAIPDLNAMSRIEALQWLIKHTRPRGYSRNTNPLRGLGGAITVGVK